MPYQDEPTPLTENINKLRRYAIALVGNGPEADDLLQECLVKALAQTKPWSKIKNPRAYLFTIMHNLFVDTLARRQRNGGEIIPIDTLENVLYSPAQQFHRVEALELEIAFRELPAEQQEVLLLTALEGMSYSDTALILGVPQGTVMSRLSRAREALRAAAAKTSKCEDPHKQDKNLFGTTTVNRRCVRDANHGLENSGSAECETEITAEIARRYAGK